MTGFGMVEENKTKATAKADPYGMTNKRTANGNNNNNNNNSKSKSKSHSNSDDNGRSNDNYG
jgi:hypothetical protein